MKFIYDGSTLALAAEGSLMDKYNKFADKVIGKQNEMIFQPTQAWLHDMLLDMWNWFVLNLPDIIGYTTIGAAILIILSSMVGKGGIMKPLGWFFGIFILAVCILGGVK